MQAANRTGGTGDDRYPANRANASPHGDCPWVTADDQVAAAALFRPSGPLRWMKSRAEARNV
jgi:hypothetical protein